MSDVDPRHAHNFSVCVDALLNGDLVLLPCSDANTGQPITVACVISGTGKPGETIAIPMFRMFDGDPLQQVKLPEDMPAVFKEHKRVKLAMQQAAAEPEAELPPAGSLH